MSFAQVADFKALLEEKTGTPAAEQSMATDAFRKMCVRTLAKHTLPFSGLHSAKRCEIRCR